MNFTIFSLLVLAVVVCTHAQKGSHRGTCPTLAPGTIGVCWEQCTSDRDCRRTEKCCSNGCGHTCTTVVKKSAVHKGSCPRVIPGQVGICVQGCQSDADCPKASKCCSTGCGVVCTPAVRGSSGRK